MFLLKNTLLLDYLLHYSLYLFIAKMLPNEVYIIYRLTTNRLPKLELYRFPRAAVQNCLYVQ
jgi:hypothetical protein